jgi:CBS domain containing-hemolysin-like protein
MLRTRRRRDRKADVDEAAVDEQEQEILRALAALRTRTAREVMTPRVDVVALEQPVTAADVTRAVKESGHSRFPVYEEDLDHLQGVLFVKDLFRLSETATPEVIARRLRKPLVVPEGRLVLELLQEMRQRRIAFAVVVDEYGGVAGVLTIKDLVAELVGDLPDEFDRDEEAEISRVDAQRWLLDGQASVDDVSEQLGIDVPEGEYVTLGGWLFDRFGRIPEEGDAVEHAGWELRVVEMDRRRIAKVVARAPDGSQPLEERPTRSGNLDPTGK